MTRTLLAGAALLAVGSLAQAADLPVPVKAPPAAIVAYSWSGAYVGGNAGWSWGRATTDQTDGSTTSTTTECFRDSSLTGGALTGATSTVVCAPNTTTTFPITTGPTTATSATHGQTDVDGFIGGLQAGYNHQFDRYWLAGLEADIQYSNQKGDSLTCSVAGCPTGSASGFASHRLKWFGTVRGRLGWLPTDRVLLYVTGGGAYGRLDSDFVSGIAGTSLLSASNDQTRWGWTAGGGVEGAVADRWTAKAEYLYIDYGSFNTNFGTGPAVTTVGTCTATGFGQSCTRITTTTTASATAKTHFIDHVVRVGLNYRLTGP